ncbi:MAG: xanthine dehydrogenase family protein molybdopterin-binding subunit [Planctomycetales bacterium]|nr:xanthine dehydrogenase family protein molybdopterin-binding subunit [Planctomycetales bacterium]
MKRVRRSQVEIEGKLRERTEVVEEDPSPPWDDRARLRVAGRPHPRLDGRAKASGAAIYTQDVGLPGMLHARILRSPHACARVLSVDASAALALDGVRAVLTQENAAAIPWYGGTTRLLERTVRYAGDEVAVVAAEDEETAEDALHLIRVRYARRRPVLDPGTAPRGGKPSVYTRGNARKAVSGAPVVVAGSYRTPAALHQAFETHGSVARWEGEHLTVWDSTQHIFGVRKELAAALGLPLHRVRVISTFMGGGFGAKNECGKYTVFAALLARRTGRPVRCLLTRAEESLAAGCRHATVQTLRLGARRDGRLLGIEHRSLCDVGAYGTDGPMPVGGPARTLYRCAAVRTEEVPVRTNTGPHTAFRAPGYVEGTFALERAMDRVAEACGLDPLEVRLRNYSPGDPRGFRYTRKGLRECYRIGAARIGWRRRARLGRRGTSLRGLGLASQVWPAGGAPPSHAVVKVNPDATAEVLIGTQDIGTGTRTVLAQIAAEELSLRARDVTVLLGDTGAGPYSLLSAGSLTTASAGPAVRAAARDARQQLEELATGLARGKGGRPGPREVCREIGDAMVIGRGARGPNPEGLKACSFGAHFAEVEVDAETGEVRIVRYVAVHEVGRVVNPLTASSQVEGGVLMGIGFALLERRIEDPATGRGIAVDLLDYKLPTALDLPPIEVLFVPGADPRATTIGAKGLGEPPIIAAPAAIANAVAHAVGADLPELPLTPDRVLEAIARGRRAP